MTTKTCKKCGWVCDIRDPNIYCPICGTRFEAGICTKCGKPVIYYRRDRCVCKTCYDTVVRNPNAYQDTQRRRKNMYAEWVEKVRKVPEDYPRLTEAQWLEAVKYFNGCAFCGADSVDARGYFIPFKNGGRYCDWNIVPMCEACSIRMKKDSNYFISRRKPAGLLNIISYLEDKLNAAITGDKQ